MSKNITTNKDFYSSSDLTEKQAIKLVQDGLKGTDFGEFYQEITETESIAKDKGQYVSIASGSGRSGFGFRAGQEERVGYAHSAVFNKNSLRTAIKSARQVLKGHKGTVNLSAGTPNPLMHKQGSPLGGFDLEQKIKKIDEIEAYTMSLDPAIKNVTIQYSARAKDVNIITASGITLQEERPLTQLYLSVAVEDGDGNTEVGMAILGGRVHCTDVFNQSVYQDAAKKALAQAKTLLIAKEAPAGIKDVVLGNGWPSVILHEAVGHGLEGDFNRRDISVYSGKVGQKVATKEVTIIDQGDLPGERGSLSFDDEGTPTQKNVLVEDGVLKGYMQDKQNAGLMGAALTGNGRRQTYAHVPMPRMTNTYFANGKYEPDEIIASVDDGLYIPDMGGGQVDITSGEFNMVATLGYVIKNGKLQEPVKGASLTGDGLTVIQSIKMMGNDLELEKSAGVCGKNGQSSIVGNGQPTVRVANMRIGGVD
jgi:TldD protein